MNNTSATTSVIPTITPRNSAGKTIQDLVSFLVSLVPDENKEAFINDYQKRIEELPFELESTLGVKGGWGSFVIDFMINACHLIKWKRLSMNAGKLSKVCAIAYLGLLDMYEENNTSRRGVRAFYKFKDNSTSLFSHERTIAICFRYGIKLDETDIECVNFMRNFTSGEKMTFIHASAEARLMQAAYQLTKVDYTE